MPEPYIVAMGGGSLLEDPPIPYMNDFLLELTGKDDPKICFIPTATGDAAPGIVRFYSVFSRKRCRPRHISLILEPPDDIDAAVLDNDVIYVGGGNTAVMLQAWRLHGMDRALKKAFDAGKVLCGGSAGANCWFEGCTTDSFTRRLTGLNDGLGFLSGAFSPHYDGEVLRRPRTHELVGSGQLPTCIAADNSTAAVYKGTEFVECVSSVPGRQVFRVERTEGGVLETPLPVRYLGDR